MGGELIIGFYCAVGRIGGRWWGCTARGAGYTGTVYGGIASTGLVA